MNILLIGHRGYLGRGLHAYLGQRHRIMGWDQEEDIFTLDAALLARQNIEAIVNLSLAADRNATTFQLDSPSDRVNVGGARHLATILKGSGIPWIQFSTREVLSAMVYGPDDVTSTPTGYRPKFLVNEESPYSPRNLYGKSKLISELIAEAHPESAIVRLTTGYTDFDRPGTGSWMMFLIRTVLAGKPVTLSRGGLPFRDPLHMDDLGRMLELIIEKSAFGERFHAGGGTDNIISLREFVMAVDPACRIEESTGGDYGYAFDVSKADRLLGWRPTVMVRERLAVLIDNVRNARIQQVEDADPAAAR